MTSIPRAPCLQQCSKTVLSVLGMNEGIFTLRGTNTYLVGRGRSRILIDTGEGKKEYLPNLEEAMRRVGADEISDIVVTHWHHDHVGGVPSILKHFGSSIKVHKIPLDNDEHERDGGDRRNTSMREPSRRPDPSVVFENLKDGQLLKRDGVTLRVLHTPGHAKDHAVLVYEEEHAMFTGDNVLGWGTTVFEDLGAYMSSLKRMSREIRDGKIRTLYPGHGPFIEGADASRRVLESYIEHRLARIAQVRDALTTTPATPRAIAEKVYKDQGLSKTLLAAATRNTLLVLQKLRLDGSALVTSDGQWHIPMSASSKY